MDKYSRALSKVFRFIAGMFCILVGLALVGVGVWGSFAVSSAFSMILIIVVLGAGFIINAGIGLAFLGDKYEHTDIVHEGETMMAVVETPQLLKRRMWVLFLGSVAYVGLMIFYIVRTIFFARLGVIDGIMIGCAVVSLIAAIIMFMMSASIKVRHFKDKSTKKEKEADNAKSYKLK